MDVIQRTEVNIPSKKVKTTHNPSMDYVELTEKDLKALVKKASTRFTSLCKDQTTDNQIISTQPVHKVLDLTVNACAPVEPTAVFFAPSQYGIVNIDITTADSKSCESTSVYISKNVLASKMDDYQTSLEKKADLMDELLTTTTSDLKKLHQVEKVSLSIFIFMSIYITKCILYFSTTYDVNIHIYNLILFIITYFHLHIMLIISLSTEGHCW